jgi:hypothetical protein
MMRAEKVEKRVNALQERRIFNVALLQSVANRSAARHR